MCSVKTPKIDTSTQKQAQQKAVYLANPWIDGLGIAGSQGRGRNSLRIDRNAPRNAISITPTQPPAHLTQKPKPGNPGTPNVSVPTPGLGIPGVGGGGGSRPRDTTELSYH